MSLTASLLCAIFSSLALALGIPNELFPSGSALFGLVALVPLYLALARSRSWLRSGLTAGLMVAATHLLSSYWLANFKEFALFTLGATTLACFFAGFLVGLLLRYALAFPAHLRPFLFACVWTVWEWGKSTGFLAYPWGTLVMTSRGLPHLVQIARLTGTWGIGWLFALVSAILAETALARVPFGGSKGPLARSIAFTVMLVLAANGYGFFRLANPERPVTTVDIVLVQQNANSWDAEGTRRAILASEALTQKAIADEGGATARSCRVERIDPSLVLGRKPRLLRAVSAGKTACRVSRRNGHAAIGRHAGALRDGTGRLFQRGCPHFA